MKSRKHRVSINRRKLTRKKICLLIYLAAVLFVFILLGFLIRRDISETAKAVPETEPAISAGANQAGSRAAGNEKIEPSEQGGPVQAADRLAASGPDGGVPETSRAEQTGEQSNAGTDGADHGADQAGGQDNAITGGAEQTKEQEAALSHAGTGGVEQMEGQNDPDSDEESPSTDEDISEYYEMPQTARYQDPVNVPEEPEQADDPQSDDIEGEPQAPPENNSDIEWSDNINNNDTRPHFSTWEELLADLELPDIEIPIPWLRRDTENGQDDTNAPEAQSGAGQIEDTPDGSDSSNQSQNLPDPGEDAWDEGGQGNDSQDSDPSLWPDLPSDEDQQFSQDPSGDDQTNPGADTEFSTDQDSSEDPSVSFADDPYEETPGGSDQDPSQDPSNNGSIEQPSESDGDNTSYPNKYNGTFLPEIPEIP